MLRAVFHLFLLLFFGVCCVPVHAQDQIIPRPVSVKIGDGNEATPVKLDSGTRISCREKDAGFQRQTRLLQQFLSDGTGLPLKGEGGKGIIRIEKDDSLKQYGPEAYRLEAAPGRIVVKAATPKGVYYAGQSLAQMLPAAFFDPGADKGAVSWKVAEKPFSMLDYPRFAWRAFMLDEARHFFGEEEVKRLIDQMGLLKMNILHWHLSDDGGWRIQIKKYPKLTSVGSKRKDTEVETWGSGKYAGKPHEGFYTQEQIRRIVRYAADRNVTIVPEIDVPGHSAAAIVSYPELKLSAKPLAEVPVSFNDGAAFDPTSERTYQFLGDVMTELVSLFPGGIIHIGGDEVRYKKYWEGVPHIEAFMKKKGIKTYPDLQIMFTNRISAMLAKKGCRVIGWNEILGSDVHHDGGQGAALGKLDGKAIIHFWYGSEKIAARAIKDGHQVVNSTAAMTYINKDYQKIPLSKSYSFEPVFAGLKPEHQRNVIGLGCQVWTEWIPDVEKLHRHVFPRIAAYAETGWTRKEDKDFQDFQRRLPGYEKILDVLNIKHGEEK
ncbi:beta-N-acetylhexosaminidase [uncultured Akkermansia sp.]|uniref:beta-N-acetylhexosaminidase n=1 Tax=uncultured Akkermansia sp. TaxID=512294 RepID=UPI00265CDCD2|nr:beta-N-acetylhexosaminidase [uncultured Akkermansia sp.]